MSRVSKIIKRNGSVVPFDRGKITTAIYKATAATGAHDRALAERLTDTVVRTLDSLEGAPSVEEIQDVVEKVLIESGHAATAKAYIVYRQERARLRRTRRGRRADDALPWKTMWKTLAWNVDHDCHTVAGLNRHVSARTFGALVESAEQATEADLDAAAQAMLETRDTTRVVLVAGPSSSGKTTTTAKLAERLEEAGLRVVPMNLDNYFFDLELHPRDESGDYDFETPEALDLKLINAHLEQLLSGREVRMPVYDFKTGRRADEQRPLRLAENDILLLDTLHGLYEPLSASVDDTAKFFVYIETVLQLRDDAGRWARWTDLRLLRRMMRDAMHRGYDPARTILHWHYVRRGELKHIIPHVGRADVVLNGALPYELPIFKRALGALMREFVLRWQDDPRHADAVSRARRIAALFDAVLEHGEEDVPATSVLREFIGGSVSGAH